MVYLALPARMSVRLRSVSLAALLLLASAARAEAHTLVSTSGPFFAGLKHFLLSPDDVLAALGVGLLASQRRDLPGWAALALPAAWLATGLCGLLLGLPEVGGEIASAVSLLVLGVLVVVALQLSLRALLVVALATGVLHGFLNGTGVSAAGVWTGGWQLVGIALPVLVVGFYPTALLEWLNRPWTRIAVRVLGSWIAAIGLLLLGWSLRAGR